MTVCRENKFVSMILTFKYLNIWHLFHIVPFIHKNVMDVPVGLFSTVLSPLSTIVLYSCFRFPSMPSSFYMLVPSSLFPLFAKPFLFCCLVESHECFKAQLKCFNAQLKCFFSGKATKSVDLSHFCVPTDTFNDMLNHLVSFWKQVMIGPLCDKVQNP